MSAIPVDALTSGAGGNELDSPGTTPPPGTATAAAADADAQAPGGHVALGDGTDAPIAVPGQEDDVEAAAADEDAAEDLDEAGEGGEGDMANASGDEGAEAVMDDDDEEDDDDEARVEAEAQAEAGPSSTPASSSAANKQKGPKTLPRKGGPHTIAAALRASRKPGTSQLPTARVKKIILSDPDVDSCGKEATFAIGKACVSCGRESMTICAAVLTCCAAARVGNLHSSPRRVSIHAGTSGQAQGSRLP